MSNSEKIRSFDPSRGEFKPYGLACTLWEPKLMRKPDRHNEIEINYFTHESIQYLIHGTQIAIPKHSFTLFWGLVPHQIIGYSGIAPYFVCTIPLTLFLSWNLPAFFVDKVLKGEVIIEPAKENPSHDVSLLSNWVNDLSGNSSSEATLLEMHARILRLASNLQETKFHERMKIHSTEISKVEQIALFVAQNYHRPITAIQIGEAVGLHPDYCNAIFKKAFGSTLGEYITQERIGHAQRLLISTDKSVTDILFECGFNSVSSFNSAFRKINNCTPREYRKEFRT